ncbi:MAG: helix-turn-helix domain-containing protein [Nitrospira sp. CG24E]|nr:MAG: helix-turn-helix domain-containing protein [Nitrospira sp. CG24E]
MSNNCYTRLSVEERETLSVGQAHGFSLRAIARMLGRAPSCIFQGVLCLNIGSTLPGILMNSRTARKYLGKGRSGRPDRLIWRRQ